MAFFSTGKKKNVSSISQLYEIEALVKKIQYLEASGKIPELQDTLFRLYSYFTVPGSGQLIVNYPDKLELGLCFAFLLKYDWEHNPNIREVWAEDGFYCFMNYLDNQRGDRQGQAQGFLLYFAMLCVGRESLKPKIQDILNKAIMMGNPLFHPDDYRIGAQNIIDQISFLCVNGMRDMGQENLPTVTKVVERFNGLEFFEQTIHRADLVKYDPLHIINKERFIAKVIESVLCSF